MRFKRKLTGAVVADVAAHEARLLASLLTELLELLGDGEDQDQDPLAAMVGLAGGPVERPGDPALARLLPDAYGDDPEAAGEFRRYTEGDLRAGKRAHASTVLTGLAPLLERGGRLPVDRDAADAWLGALNDLRLVLGTRLQVTEETDLEPAGDDPRGQLLQVYGWLGWLQETLLGCIEPRTPGN